MASEYFPNLRTRSNAPFGAQLAAAIEHDVVFEGLRIQTLAADIGELANQLITVAQGEFDFDLLRHHDTRSTSTPGSFSPAMNSSDAPPPVER